MALTNNHFKTAVVLSQNWHGAVKVYRVRILHITALSMVSKSGEIGVLEAIRQRAALAGRSPLVLGIGDDCAVFRPRGSPDDLLFTTDLLLEDVHFRRDTHRPEDVGHKALARGLSDIAAMGGEPRFCLVSLSLAPWADRRWLNGFYRGLLRLAKRYAAPLAGGDLARSAQLACDIVVCGAAPKGRALRRDGARPGDGIFVSGRLGGWHWVSRPKRARRGSGTCAHSRGWSWDASCARPCAPPRPWT